MILFRRISLLGSRLSEGACARVSINQRAVIGESRRPACAGCSHGAGGIPWRKGETIRLNSSL